MLKNTFFNNNQYRSDFEIFKSNVCHHLKNSGDISFIKEILETDIINKYFEKKWIAECLYTLAMLDYLCRLNHLPICTNYNLLRTYKFKEPVYPKSIIALSVFTNDELIKEKSYDNSIPEFKRFNIIENEVRDVC